MAFVATDNRVERITYFDSARVVAILAVVMLHCSTMFLDATGMDFVYGSILNSLTRFGVPCFVMISGAIFLDENRKLTVPHIIKKYVMGIVWLIVAWNIIYAILYTILLPIYRGGVEAIDYKIFTGRLIFSEGHMWFLYMIIWLYLITPLLRCFVSKAKITLVRYFIILGLVIFFTRPLIEVLQSILPFNTSLLSILDNFHADFVGGFTVYYITGWYLQNSELGVKLYHALYTVAILSITLVILLINALPEFVDTINCNENILIFFYSTGVFILLKHLEFPQWIRNLAPYVFGIYIIHPIFIFLFNEWSEYANNVTIYMAKWIVVSIITCLVAFLFTRVKYLRRLVKA